MKHSWRSAPPVSRTHLSAPFQWVARVLWRPLYGPPTTPTAEPDRRTELGELVSLAFTVCLALFLVKGFIAYRDLNRAEMPPQVFTGQVFVSFGQVWACSAEDFAVGLGCVLLGGIGLRCLRRAGYRRALRVLAHVAAALALGYMIVNVQIFHVVRRFMTLSLFQMGGGFKPEKSVAAGIPVAAKAALAIFPLATLALHLLVFSRSAPFWRGLTRYLCRPLVLLGLIGGLAGISHATQKTLLADHRGDFAQNPHLLLARSLFAQLDFGDVGNEPPETTEFLPGQPRLSRLSLAKRPTNVIVLVCESLGSRYCQLTGYSQETTPNLCRLAARGLTFDNFYANNNHTIASALPLFGATWNDPRTLGTMVEYPQFPVASAGEWLRQRGYHTAFLGAGGASAWEGYRNLGAFAKTGFDLGRERDHPFWQNLGGRRGFWDEDYMDADLFADARRVVRGSAGQGPFFLMLWNYDTHWPYHHDEGPEWQSDPVAESLKESEWSDSYRRFLNGIHYTDAQIGAFYDELERLGLADDTLVVVTGDHGEGFGQHGNMTHGGSLYDEEVRVPLLLINRHVAEAAGKRSAVVGSHIDVWPTIADICDLPCDPRWQGRSLFGDDADRRAYFSRREQCGVREGRFKYIWDHEKSREWLFDLEADPDERTDLAKQDRAYCLRQRRRLRDWTVFQTELTKERLLEVTREK